MICFECEHFEVQFRPERIEMGSFSYIEFGRCHCKKYNLVADFSSTKGLKSLKCINEGGDIDGEADIQVEDIQVESDY